MEKMSAVRRPKWQFMQQAQPTPRILQLPLRPRQKLAKSNFLGKQIRERTGKLEVLFDQEGELSKRIDVPLVMVSAGGECEERRGRVEEVTESNYGVVAMEEEKWRFQAEMLRAECNLLRIEREVAVKKMERRIVQVERMLRSSVQSLASGRKKICDGENVIAVLEDEIQTLTEKLDKLKRRSGVKYLEVKSCSNFDTKASLLERRLVKVGGISDEPRVKEIQQMEEASLSIKSSCRVEESFISNENGYMEILRRKMEGLSKGKLLERMKEEYGSMLSTGNSSAACSASTSKQIEVPDVSSSPKRLPYKEEKVCSGHCQAVVRRIVEQVLAETEQWSQMQETLGEVRDDMEELQVSRDFWEDHALDSDYQIQSLVSTVQGWRQKALSSETKANKLQAQVTMLRKEIEWLKKEQVTEPSRGKTSPPLAADAQNEMEKRVLVCRLKENHRTNDDLTRQRELLRDGRRKTKACSSGTVAQKGSPPLGDIGNLSSPLLRQNSKTVVHPLHYNAEKKFREGENYANRLLFNHGI